MSAQKPVTSGSASGCCKLMMAVVFIASLCAPVGRASVGVGLATEPVRRGRGNCGDNRCVCSKYKATCRDSNLTYIPRFGDNITTLVFEDNFLSTLSEETLSNVSAHRIVELSLSRNKIINITANVFAHFRNLRVLRLDENKNIRASELFESLRSLQTTQEMRLYLSKMRLNDFMGLPPALNHTNLKYLDLSHNKLTGLYDGDRYLRHHGNATTHVLTRHPVLRHLTTVLLNNNHLLGEVRASWFCSHDNHTLFPELTSIQMENNFLTEITNDSFRCLPNLQKLDLNGNDFRELKKNSFFRLPRLKLLQFGQMHKSIKDIANYAFNNSHLQHLGFKENNIVIGRDLANRLFHGVRGLLFLDISVNNLKRLDPPDVLDMLAPLQALQHLIACHCSIVTLSPKLLQTLPNLTTLNLDGNSLHTLGPTFQNVHSLKTLSLQGNSFNVINQDDISENFMNSLEKINLSNNPYDCTCSLLWFRSKINDGARKFGNITLVTWPYRYDCMSPPSLTKTRLVKYKPTKASCQNLAVVLIVCLACALVTVVIGCVVWYKYSWHIKYRLYKLRSCRRRDPERAPLLEPEATTYDGFVIYQASDSEFVLGPLRQLVEEELGYRLLLWDRDVDGGRSRLQAFAEGLEASRRVVAVLSQAALDDSWLRFQVEVAMGRQLEEGRGDRRPLMMMMTLEELDYGRLSTYWCVLLTRLEGARWCEDRTHVRRAVLRQQLHRHLKPK